MYFYNALTYSGLYKGLWQNSARFFRIVANIVDVIESIVSGDTILLLMRITFAGQIWQDIISIKAWSIINQARTLANQTTYHTKSTRWTSISNCFLNERWHMRTYMALSPQLQFHTITRIIVFWIPDNSLTEIHRSLVSTFAVQKKGIYRGLDDPSRECKLSSLNYPISPNRRHQIADWTPLNEIQTANDRQYAQSFYDGM